MKDKLFYLTVGLLIGIVVMQWTAPNPQATIVTQPAGNVIALAGDWAITTSGEMYFWHDGNYWVGPRQVPFPVSELRFAAMDSGGRVTFIDAEGNYWDEGRGNVGPPPTGAVQTSPETWGKIKATYEKK